MCVFVIHITHYILHLSQNPLHANTNARLYFAFTFIWDRDYVFLIEEDQKTDRFLYSPHVCEFTSFS